MQPTPYFIYTAKLRFEISDWSIKLANQSRLYVGTIKLSMWIVQISIVVSGALISDY